MKSMAKQNTNKESAKQYVTDSNFPVKRIYHKSSKKYIKEDSGVYPFTRGIHPEMFRERF